MDNDALASPRLVALQAHRLGLPGATTSGRRGDTSRAQRIARFAQTHVMHDHANQVRTQALAWPIVPRVGARAIDQILENLGMIWWAVLGLNQ
jgi:hypothetical protein